MRKVSGFVQGQFGGWKAWGSEAARLRVQEPRVLCGVVGFVQGFRSLNLLGYPRLPCVRGSPGPSPLVPRSIPGAAAPARPTLCAPGPMVTTFYTMK